MHNIDTGITGSTTSFAALSQSLAIGDVIFIRVPLRVFREVASATGSWTNHVGVVVDIDANGPLVGESKFPFSRITPLHRFLRRSERGRVAVCRLKTGLSEQQRERLLRAATDRLGTLYDTGFDLRSRRQFCSRFVREVYADAIGVSIGEIESFAMLLARRPATDLRFWSLWYFGRIPWCRETVSPASLLVSPHLQTVFDGIAVACGSAAAEKQR